MGVVQPQQAGATTTGRCNHNRQVQLQQAGATMPKRAHCISVHTTSLLQQTPRHPTRRRAAPPGVLKLELSHDAVVSRRHRQRAAPDAAAHQPPQQRDAQRGALRRVGARAQLVQKDEGLAIRLAAQGLDPGGPGRVCVGTRAWVSAGRLRMLLCTRVCCCVRVSIVYVSTCAGAPCVPALSVRPHAGAAIHAHKTHGKTAAPADASPPPAPRGPHLLRWPLKVGRLAVRLCSSPMSARTDE